MFYADALFKNPQLREDLAKNASKELQDEHELFVSWSNAHGFARPVVTCGGRNQTVNEAVGGVEKSLHIYDENGIFHAIDYSIRQYHVEELKEIIAYWDVRSFKTKGRVSIVHNLNHGTAPHLHAQVKPTPVPEIPHA